VKNNIETNKKMENRELSQLSDQELLVEAKKMKSFSITNAFLIGFLLGIVVFSVIKSTFGFLMLIPLYFAHKMINDPKNKKIKELEVLLKERDLK
jgi:riboflavin transporter FmnP